MVDANQYVARLVSAIDQFRLARRTLEEFGRSPAALERLLAEESSKLRESLEMLADPTAPDEVVKRRNELLDRYVESRQESISRQLADVANRVNQNEIILLAALFENQMKQIHREVLRNDRSALRPDRTVPLGRLIAEGPDAIVAEEIEREVQSLDRKSVDDRARYFNERLKMDWFGGAAIPLVERVLRLRNVLLHGDPDAPVSNTDVETARFVAFSVPMYCCLQGADRFPEAFPGWATSSGGEGSKSA